MDEDKFMMSSWSLRLLILIYVGCSCFIYVFVLIIQHDFHITWESCRITVTLRVSLVEQELLTLPRNHRVHTVFSGADALQFEVFCVVFGRLWYVFCPMSFGHYIIFDSLNYGFWLSWNKFIFIEKLWLFQKRVTLNLYTLIDWVWG